MSVVDEIIGQSRAVVREEVPLRDFIRLSSVEERWWGKKRSYWIC